MNCKECQIQIPENRVFCSRKCSSKNINRIMAERAKIRNSKKCPICKINTTNPKFCSHKCYSKYKEIVEKKKYYCKCGEFICSGWTKKVYCNKCKNTNKNPNYKNWSIVTQGELKKRIGTQQYHSRLRSLARTFYKRSDKPKLCCVCGYDKFYEVCHIIPINKFNDNSTVAEINSLTNLIALCPNCHWEFDHNLIQIPDIRVART